MKNIFTSLKPVYIDTELLPNDLKGILSVNLPEELPNLGHNTVCHVVVLDSLEPPLREKSVVAIICGGCEDSEKGRMPTKTLTNGSKVYLTEDGVRRLKKASPKVRTFDWLLET
jgi:hypothetical protein